MSEDALRRRIEELEAELAERDRSSVASNAMAARFRAMVENGADAMWLFGPDSIVTYASPSTRRILGIGPSHVVGTVASLWVHADDRGRVERETRALFRDPTRGRVFEFRTPEIDGVARWVECTATNMLADPAVGAIVLNVRDITDRKRAEERGAAVVATALDAVIVTDEDGKIIEFNPAAEHTFGIARARALGATLAETIIPERFRREHEDGVARLRATGIPSILGKRVERWAMRADGTEIPVELSVSRVGTATASVYVGFIRDLSDKRMAEAALRRSEEELRQAQKMEAVGRLAGGVAHDFNNLLTVILSYTAILVEGTGVGDPARADLEEVQSAAERATELTRQLLAFSRKQLLAPVVMDLNDSVRGVQKLLARLLGEDVGLSLHTTTHPCPVDADPGQIEQVIMNLVVNARDAMPTGGSITLETSNVVLQAARSDHGALVPPGRYSMIAVTDTGTGMDDATIERIFEPFFTTKDTSKGTGLGLSTVYGIIQQSGGHILVRSAMGKGSTFEVYLPCSERDAANPLPAPPFAAARRQATETILLVEDEEPVRLVIRTILRKLGYHVLEAQNGGEAFLLSEQHAGTIDLLLTDMVMPRMNGRQLAERLAVHRPDMKILYMSGYTEDGRVRDGVHDAEMAFLQKPITPGALLEKVRQVLEGERTVASVG
ncbi:MAG: Blue-light-activated protein [Labilithrix sp.]|nr:Blue-light-activated protein [Labilithrix sp.]